MRFLFIISILLIFIIRFCYIKLFVGSVYLFNSFPNIDLTDDVVLMLSVLEQFNITKYNLLSGVLDALIPLSIITPFVYIDFRSIIERRSYKFLGVTLIKVQRCLQVILRFIFSLFGPTPDNTKNFYYSRWVQLVTKMFFKLYIKRKLSIFCKTNTYIVKIKIQLGIQEGVRSNFGHSYPFVNRLYEFYPFMFTIFFLIVLNNLNGLLFYGFTNTAFLVQNLSFSSQIVLGVTICGIGIRSYHFYKMFVPSGVPKALLPFLVIIEVISHIAKIFSLAIRLFANMMSGHVLLHILTGFFLQLAKKNFLLIIFPTLLIFAIVSLEYGITFLQAYVFVTLMAIYFEEHFSFSKYDTTKVFNTQFIRGVSKSVLSNDIFYLANLKRIPVNKDLLFCYVESYRRRQKRKMVSRRYFNIFSFLVFKN